MDSEMNGVKVGPCGTLLLRECLPVPLTFQTHSRKTQRASTTIAPMTIPPIAPPLRPLLELEVISPGLEFCSIFVLGEAFAELPESVVLLVELGRNHTEVDDDVDSIVELQWVKVFPDVVAMFSVRKSCVQRLVSRDNPAVHGIKYFDCLTAD
ncbi:hypothetical protein VKT23_012423 [Stygiomarasmius scandens]|uniref:Uncharacterized protein n=1 Tax=Marasmiellus scandens TaxID=2682957 RepID=A0ABR1J8N7_9AGAR